MKKEILKEISKVAGELPEAVIASFCEKLESLPENAAYVDMKTVADNMAQSNAVFLLTRLVKNWNNANAGGPKRLAWALRGASTMDEFRRASQRLELIWTGPFPEGSVFRRTDQALLDLIHEAEKELLIVTFAAYKFPAIVDSLRECHHRGVTITFVPESADASKGIIQYDAVKGLGKELAEIAKIFVWPEEQREKDEAGNCGALHAKCAVADKKALMISSANLTGHAMNLNMEMGVFVRGGDLPRQVHEHFKNLIAQKVLVKACPPMKMHADALDTDEDTSRYQQSYFEQLTNRET